MVRRESARSVRQDCFLPEWHSPFVQVTAKQRRSADPATVMHLVKPQWQAKSRATQRALLPENSQPQAKLLVQLLAKPPLLEPQDSPLLQATGILRAQVRARQCLQ